MWRITPQDHDQEGPIPLHAHPTARSRRTHRLTAWLGASALVATGLALATGAPGEAVTDEARATRAAAPAIAATPPTYERDLTSELDASRSYATIKHLVEQIGPRVNGTPAERRGAEYLRDVLEPLGYEVELQTWGPVSTKRPADVVTAAVGDIPAVALPGGPKWQMAASPFGVFTGDAAPVTAEVVPVGTGQSAADYTPAVGKIAFAIVSTTAQRTLATTLAGASGAKALILAPPPHTTRTSVAPAATITTGTAPVTIPVLGAGSDHTIWLNQLLANGGRVALRVVTNEYVNPMGTNIIATRHAVGDPQGTTAPIVMVGAHIDSVLGAPGGHDDASGNGVSTELGRVLASLPYDKEIRIGGFGGEEGGLLGAKAYVNTLTKAEQARFVGEWQMDMVGTPYQPAKLWALTPDGKSNYVIDQAYAAAQRDGFDGLQNCKLGQSDHQAFFDVGIPAALFIWLDYTKPTAPATCESITRGSYTTEPEYHRPSDGMNNVSQDRLQITLDVIGGAVIQNALNGLAVTVKTDAGAPLVGAQVLVDCGDGSHDAGITDAAGLTTARVPAGSCTLTTGQGSSKVTRTVPMSGDEAVTLTLDTTAPTVDLVRPVDGATYPQGAQVGVLYFCQDAATTTCTGTQRSGVDLDTATPGEHTFTVTAADPNGNTTTRTATYRVSGPATASLSASAAPSAYGDVPVLTVEVGPSGLPAGGSIEVRDGDRVLATASGAAGKRRIALPARLLRPGSTRLQVVHLGADGSSDATAEVSVVVAKATGTISAKRTVVRVGQRGRLPVTLSVSPSSAVDLATGKVTVKAGGRVLGTGRVVGGKAVVRLWKVKGAGSYRVTLTYTGTDLVSGDTAAAKLVVRR